MRRGFAAGSEEMKLAARKNHQVTVPSTSADERRLLPMLIGGLVLVVIGMIMVMAFV